MISRDIVYFDKAGEQNTDDTIRLALERAIELQLRYLVVATSSGATGLKAAKAFKGSGIQVVVVGHQVGFSKPGVDEMEEKNQKEIEALGGVIIKQTHALSAVERSISRRLGGASRTEAISEALRTLVSSGAKVCVEITIMAADGGRIPVDGKTEVLAIGGTWSGADTACVMLPAHANNFFDMQIREIIAMPRDKARQ
jgi:hypothetical protein